LASTLLCLLMLGPPAHAAFPGANGKIAFQRNGNIWTIDSNGSNPTELTNASGTNQDAGWSSDGSRIAFSTNRDGNYEIYVMTGEGLGESRVTSYTGDDFHPTWAPDGQKIAFDRSQPSLDVFSANPDGTGVTNLTGGQGGNQPAWSPDGQKIAFIFGNNIFVMNADGTGRTQLTNYPPPTRTSFQEPRRPDWSPDGSQIVYALAFGGVSFGESALHVMNANGSGGGQLGSTAYPYDDDEPAFSPDGRYVVFECGDNLCVEPSDGSAESTVVPGTLPFDRAPNWQPVPTGYPRPKGATPIYIPLVPAFEQCTSPNRQHGAPLSHGSCAPPAQTSSHLTVGTPDANGQAPNSIGSVLYRVTSADVEVTASVSDVRNQGTLADYTGELSVEHAVQLTDRQNGPGQNEPATVQPFQFKFPVSCAATASTTVGGRCALSSSFNALMPGSVVELKRAIWKLGAIQVFDGGPDGLASTGADNTLFLDQGVFVP
jgi:WD40-like Beta Propeller Repeat